MRPAAAETTTKALAQLRLLQSLTIGCHRACTLELRGSSLSSLPLQRSKNGEATIYTPDLPQSDYDATYRVSHPPGDLTPPRTLPACFIRHTLVGFHPSELSSSPAAVAPLDARCRHDVGTHSNHRPVRDSCHGK